MIHIIEQSAEKLEIRYSFPYWFVYPVLFLSAAIGGNLYYNFIAKPDFDSDAKIALPIIYFLMYLFFENFVKPVILIGNSRSKTLKIKFRFVFSILSRNFRTFKTDEIEKIILGVDKSVRGESYFYGILLKSGKIQRFSGSFNWDNQNRQKFVKLAN